MDAAASKAWALYIDYYLYMCMYIYIDNYAVMQWSIIPSRSYAVEADLVTLFPRASTRLERRCCMPLAGEEGGRWEGDRGEATSRMKGKGLDKSFCNCKQKGKGEGQGSVYIYDRYDIYIYYNDR
jgi:hypothetical protein